MDAAGKLCNINFSHLPSRQACQNIADEGQVVVKELVRERRVLKRSDGFGLYKDGTTHKKVKILNTSDTTSNGSFCLGWSSILSEMLRQGRP